MGLGKTLQTIAHILIEKRARPARSPGADRHADEPGRQLAARAREVRADAARSRPARARAPRAARASSPSHDVVITTYPLVARDRDELADDRRSTCSSSTRRRRSRTTTRRRAEAVRALDARHRVCLSGTPIENHLGELWSLFDFLIPGPARHAATSSRSSSASRSRSSGDKRPARGAARARAAVHPAPHEGRGRARAAAEDRARARGRAGRRAARALREHPRRRARRRPRAHQAARPRRLDDRDPRRAAQAAPGLLRSAARRGEAARERQRAARSSTCCSSWSRTQLADGRRILVFSQFARMLGLISEGLLAQRHRPRHADRQHARSPEADRRVPERPRRRVPDHAQGRRRRAST